MITAILTKYKRLNEISMIKDILYRHYMIDEILVRDNSDENLLSYGKYLLIPKAKNEIIYYQDDDCIVNNLNELLQSFDGHTMLNNIKASHMDMYSGKDSMMGWGSVFKKSWVSRLGDYIMKYGVDKYMLREADRIFTCLIPHKNILADITDFPSANAEYALYKQPEHQGFKHEAIRRACEL